MTGATTVLGGIQTANRNVLHGLARICATAREPLDVLSLLEGDAARPDFLAAEVRFRGFHGRRSDFSLSLLGAAMRRSLVCVDHVTLALPLLPLVRAGWVRTVIFAHGSEAWKRARPSSVRSLCNATLVLTNSVYTLRKMRATLPPFHGRDCTLGLAPEFPLEPTPPPAPDSSPRLVAADGRERQVGPRSLLLVGRMHPAEREKGHFELIRCLSELRKRFAQVQLVFPGPGEDRGALAEHARRHHVADAVLLPGPVPPALLRELYACAYAYVMPSRQEGFGLAYLEAMSHAKPCLGSLDDGAEEIIVDGETGILVRDPGDPVELTARLRELLADPQRAATMGRRGFARLHERFTAAHHQQRVYEAIGPLLGTSAIQAPSSEPRAPLP